MNPTERDKLLIELKETFGRIDERTNNIYTLTEKQEQHLDKLNNAILKQWKQISSNKTSISRLWWFIGIVALIGGGLIGGGLTGLLGWLGY